MKERNISTGGHVYLVELTQPGWLLGAQVTPDPTTAFNNLTERKK